ncbi:DNA repair protein RecN [Dongia soli]|uniref:DNA repair protein RecN n=1 Tax=Dongia soli TaxID=600628 RepID=A0ABU5E6E5_9PROT|nr:DNA repair protein RecN [Dongia soli]MDY0881289.1 DNA repair protein RecN [Dongia soli]
MLVALTVQNVVLIEKLDLAFDAGLTVLTGETGAGKSILLDALGLALGARADAGLVRQGASQASVTAEFNLADDHPVLAILAEQEIDIDGGLILRRQLGSDGRSRAFVNDQPVSIGLLRRLGDALIEIEGQFEAQGLLDPATHQRHLDGYGGNESKAAVCGAAHRRWRDAVAAYETAQAELDRAKADEDYLRHAVEELELAHPLPAEETELVAERALLANRAQLIEAIDAVNVELAGDKGADRAIAAAQRRLDRLGDRLGDQATHQLQPVVAALDRASIELAEAISQLQHMAADLDADPKRLDRIEERLYLLRDLGRKHQVPVEALPDLLAKLTQRLANLDDRGQNMAKLQGEVETSRKLYIDAASALSKARQKAAKAMDAAVNAELAPLKLEKARFATRIETAPEEHWSATGWDRVTFEVATNPGAPPGAINRIASGGELARFMLALKVTLAANQPVPTLVFDEVDAGIGGATAAAVGERLKRLAKAVQLLVITHSPQVAALGHQHWRVEKSGSKTATTTTVRPLDEPARREEIARMLSGATITDEARAAATKLLASAS